MDCTLQGAFQFNVKEAQQNAQQGTPAGDFTAAAMYYSAAMNGACLKHPRDNIESLMNLSRQSRSAYDQKVASTTGVCPPCPDVVASRDTAGVGGGAEGEDKDKCPTEFKPFDASKALTFDQIIGLETVKERVLDDVVTPMKYPVIAKQQKLPPPNVLLYGLGGVGKTVIAEAVARDTGTTIYEASAGQIKGKFVGQSEKCLEELLNLGKQGDGAIVFLDEIDSLLAGDGDIEKAFQGNFKIVVQTGSDKQPPVIMGATNTPWRITDGAIQRRFGLKLYISLPTPDQRVQYLKMLGGQLKDCRGQKRSLDNISIDEWIKLRDMTKAFSPDNLRVLFETARRVNPKSLSHQANLFFCKKPDGTYDVLLPAEATGQSNCVQGLSTLSDDEQTKICWPVARFQDFQRVLAEGIVRTTATVRELQEFKDYANLVKDFASIPDIDRSIAELQS